MVYTAQQILLALVFIVLIVTVVCAKVSCRDRREDYRDPIWLSRDKMYADYYPRANGSIYGTPDGGWDIFSGVYFYPKAY